MSDIMKIKEYFLSCVAAVINGGDTPDMPEDVEPEKVFELAVRNASQTLLYYANENRRVFPDVVSLKLKKAFQAAVMRETGQQAEIAKIRTEFAEKSLDFMLLKGAHLKGLYPKSEMRFMVDMDVLVKAEDVEAAKEILLTHGLRQQMNNEKDIVLVKAPFLTVELHNSLFVEDNYMHGYFTGVWDRAQPTGDGEYAMSDNDLYIYTLAHLAEHYTAAGSCFRPVIDIYLMNEKYADRLDRAYIEAELEKLELCEFEKKIRSLGECIFKGAQYDDALTLMENYIVFGPPVKNAAEAVNADKSKATRIRRMLFPNLRHMQRLFPILEKLPFLLPFFWAVRFFRYAFTKRARAKLKAISTTDNEQYGMLKKIYEDSGIKKY